MTQRGVTPDIDARYEIIDARGGSYAAAFAQDVNAGLLAQPKSLPCRYFYDAEGSRLFEAICDLPEYYLTRAEREILVERSAELEARLPTGATLVELGSGSAEKTRILIGAMLPRRERLCYVPIDVSSEMLEGSARGLLGQYPGLEIMAIAGEYQDGLRHLRAHAGPPWLILWLGSSIGNLERHEAAVFLRQFSDAARSGDRLLIGVDMRKDRDVLVRAYDDATGVTARFNLNLLGRINRELRGRFDLARFRHRAVYNEPEGRIEMYLASTEAQRVAIDGLGIEVSFEAGEAIHTENSYKYSPAEIEALAEEAGLGLEAQWFDAGRRFSVNLFVPAGS